MNLKLWIFFVCLVYCSYSLRRSVVMYMALTRNGRSYCLGISTLLVHILVVTLVKILGVFQTISCLLCNKSLLEGDLISLSMEMTTIQQMEQGYASLCFFHKKWKFFYILISYSLFYICFFFFFAQVRDYIHVMDLADGHIAALRKLEDCKIGMMILTTPFVFLLHCEIILSSVISLCVFYFRLWSVQSWNWKWNICSWNGWCLWESVRKGKQHRRILLFLDSW